MQLKKSCCDLTNFLPYSIPLCTILTKWPAPSSPTQSQQGSFSHWAQIVWKVFFSLDYDWEKFLMSHWEVRKKTKKYTVSWNLFWRRSIRRYLRLFFMHRRLKLYQIFTLQKNSWCNNILTHCVKSTSLGIWIENYKNKPNDSWH